MFNGIHNLYALRTDTAAQQIRTHEDGHLPRILRELEQRRNNK